jgi:hypothetical protein
MLKNVQQKLSFKDSMVRVQRIVIAPALSHGYLSEVQRIVPYPILPD